MGDGVSGFGCGVRGVGSEFAGWGVELGVWGLEFGVWSLGGFAGSTLRLETACDAITWEAPTTGARRAAARSTSRESANA